MVKFDWIPEKNSCLKVERKVSFEEIALLLANGQLWKVMEHPNQENYPHQQVFLVPINGYIHFVPFVIDGDTFFLKTAIPSRKATKDYHTEMESQK